MERQLPARCTRRSVSLRVGHLPAAYRVRSGAIVAPAELPFSEVMVRRFGHPSGRFDLAVEQVDEPAGRF